MLKPHDLLGKDEEFNEDSLERCEGVCESSCLKLTEGAVVQFERVGFCKLDEKKGMVFVRAS